MKLVRSNYFQIVIIFYFLLGITDYFFYDKFAFPFLLGGLLMFFLLYKFKLLKEGKLNKPEKKKYYRWKNSLLDVSDF